MINTAETQPPVIVKKTINASETMPPERVNGKSQSIVLSNGTFFANGFIIHSLLTDHGKQSVVYLAQKDTVSYAVKVYNQGFCHSSKMQIFLTHAQHPNIASVIDCGVYEGYDYEIYPYYPEGDLEHSGKMSLYDIEHVIVPSINEGLHFLHTNGIVHCDIKPSNLFTDQDKKTVVIGDFGISDFTNANGILLGDVRGTSQYAPRVKMHAGKMVITSAYDYASFGLVLCKIVLGYSLFHQMSLEDIVQSWEEGLTFPREIDGRMLEIVRGLLHDDEKQRWGYEQVRRWCEGEYIGKSNQNKYVRPKAVKPITPFVFGQFNGEILSVNTLHQLALAVKKHWNQASRIIKQQLLVDFIHQFDATLAKNIKKLQYERDSDVAIYQLLLYIEENTQSIFFCGQEYKTLSDYIDQLSAGQDEIAQKFFSSGLLVRYLRQNNYLAALVDQLEMYIQKNNPENMTAAFAICFALRNEQSINVYGATVTSLDSLIPVLSRCSIAQIDELLDNERFVAWLHKLGYEKEVNQMKEMY